MTMTPSTDESPMSVRSESPYGKRHGLKLDSGLGRLRDSGDSVTMSAPNTPGSKRALMPRYLTQFIANLTIFQESMWRQDIQPQPRLARGDAHTLRGCPGPGPGLPEVTLAPLLHNQRRLGLWDLGLQLQTEARSPGPVSQHIEVVITHTHFRRPRRLFF